MTKLSRINFASREQAQVENYRKMIMAMAQDLRVVLIKLADRLHNMRTIGALPKQKQLQKAKETLEIYAPLAHRLGIHTIKWELEDLGLPHAAPAPLRRDRGDGQPAPRRPRALRRGGRRRSSPRELDEAAIEADISAGPSTSTRSTRRWRRGQGVQRDLRPDRACACSSTSVKDCYGAIGIIHSLWKPMPGRFKDYVAMPKFNVYQSLHTTVIGPQGKPLEIQVRTTEMHLTAEYGIAAHWLLQDGKAPHARPAEQPGSAADGLAAGRGRPDDFMDALRVDLFDDEVYVFTPKGEVKSLPAGATPLDFAYAVHTDVGHRCVGAKVNGRIVPLHYTLSRVTSSRC